MNAIPIRLGLISRKNQISTKVHNMACNIYVVVQFYPWFNLVFSIVLIRCMVIYDDEYKTKENTKWYQEQN